MDRNEIIALGIVALAALLAARYLLSKKGSGCCSAGCLPKSEPKENLDKKSNKTV